MRRRFAGWLRLWAVVATCLVPAAALACPACAGRNDGNARTKIYLLGSMILFPFAVALVVTQVVRSKEGE